jgi:hypothetical protein
VDEAKEPNKSFQPFQISGDLSLFLSNDHQLCYLYLHYECSLRPVFDAEVRGLVAEMRAVTIKALEKFWCITQMPMDEDNKKIVARSFGYKRFASFILYKLRYIISKSANAFKCLGDSLTICQIN